MQRVYGWKPQPSDERDLMYAKAQPHYSFPASVDLRDNMPPIEDQGQLGSCTSFGIGRCLQYAQNKAKILSFGPSHLFIYYNERWEEGTISQDAGANIRDGIKACNIYGFAPEEIWPYNISRFTEKPPQAAYDAALQDRIHFYASIDNSNVNNIKLALVHGYPVVFGFRVFQNFEDYKVGDILQLPDPTAQSLGGHCVCISGYDDSKGAFLVANSWGESFGESGYYWQSYDYMTSNLCSDFWVIRLR
jgi:C1A family cysteine protease